MAVGTVIGLGGAVVLTRVISKQALWYYRHLMRGLF